MSDPTIQTFCCHHTGNKEDFAVKIMNEFNTDSYNIVCLISSTVGILGSVYQIFPDVINRIQRGVGSTHGRRIIIWLAVADLLASFGVLVRSSLWLRYKNIMPLPDDDVSVLFCSITSAWTQYFYTVTWFWTLFYAIDTWLTIKGRDSHTLLYHSIAWGLPAATTGVGLSILYIPNAKCHNLPTVTSALYKILPNYCATYVPIAMVMIVNPIMYMMSSKDVEMAVAVPLSQGAFPLKRSWAERSGIVQSQWLKFLIASVVSSVIGRFRSAPPSSASVETRPKSWQPTLHQMFLFTSKERRVVDTLRLKFFLINVVFYLCWLPNLVNGFLLWTMWFNMPVKVIITTWYIMALTNPMQALLNALVYRKWNTNKWRNMPSFSNESRKEFCFYDEQSPLLGSEPPRLQLSPIPPGINNYATL